MRYSTPVILRKKVKSEGFNFDRRISRRGSAVHIEILHFVQDDMTGRKQGDTAERKQDDIYVNESGWQMTENITNKAGD